MGCFFSCLMILRAPFAQASSASADFLATDLCGSPNTTNQQWNTFPSALNGPNLQDMASNNPDWTTQLIMTLKAVH
ncbi:MAG TPA: hypothetical protein DCF63_20435 [Planctomycetaceae bacterium]|nr:hypothetical protein [Planctomycetaceae bacterium]